MSIWNYISILNLLLCGLLFWQMRRNFSRMRMELMRMQADMEQMVLLQDSKKKTTEQLRRLTQWH